MRHARHPGAVDNAHKKRERPFSSPEEQPLPTQPTPYLEMIATHLNAPYRTDRLPDLDWAAKWAKAKVAEWAEFASSASKTGESQ